MRYVNRFLAIFRQNARTVGLSPKALAPIIGGAIVALAKAVGLDSDELAGLIGVVAASAAAVLLPPGDVVAAPADAVASDDLLSADVKAKLAG